MNRIRYYLLSPLAVIYGFIGGWRRAWFNRKENRRYHPTLPTICIGNLAVGGTGKTPHTEFLLRALNDKKMAVLSRGYGRKTKGFACSTMTGMQVTAETFGDEPAQIHHKFSDIPIAVSESRAKGIQRLQAELENLELILLDDAYQHLPVQCGCNILLTEYARPYWTDLPLPAGNLREFPCAAKEADIIVVSKCPPDLSEKEASEMCRLSKKLPRQQCFFSTFIYDSPIAANQTAKKALSAPSPSDPVWLLTGIAHANPLYLHLKNSFKEVTHIEFPDHHCYKSVEIQLLCRKMANSEHPPVLFTTEKDWERLKWADEQGELDAIAVYIIPIRVKFLFGQEIEFVEKIRSCCLWQQDLI